MISKTYQFLIDLVIHTIVLILVWPFPKTTKAINETFIFSPKPMVVLQLQNQYDIDKLKMPINTDKSIYILKGMPLPSYIWQYLTNEMGLSDVAAAGILGNMMVECGGYSFNLQPYIYSPGGYYYGLCQWGTSNHHASVNGYSVEGQLSYLRSTIESEMGQGNYTRFINASTAEESSIIFAQWYERCADPYGRQACARRAYERYAR